MVKWQHTFNYYHSLLSALEKVKLYFSKTKTHKSLFMQRGLKRYYWEMFCSVDALNYLFSLSGLCISFVIALKLWCLGYLSPPSIHRPKPSPCSFLRKFTKDRPPDRNEHEVVQSFWKESQVCFSMLYPWSWSKKYICPRLDFSIFLVGGCHLHNCHSYFRSTVSNWSVDSFIKTGQRLAECYSGLQCICQFEILHRDMIDRLWCD